jgi:hypothetical protein
MLQDHRLRIGTIADISLLQIFHCRLASSCVSSVYGQALKNMRSTGGWGYSSLATFPLPGMPRMASASHQKNHFGRSHQGAIDGGVLRARRTTQHRVTGSSERGGRSASHA